MKYEKANANYQVDSTSSSTKSMDTVVVAKPVTKPGSVTPSTIDHVDATAKKKHHSRPLGNSAIAQKEFQPHRGGPYGQPCIAGAR